MNELIICPEDKSVINSKFVDYAHRGSAQYYPENTMVFFGKGVELGVNGYVKKILN